MIFCKQLAFLFGIIFCCQNINSQNLYFPPTTGNNWDTIAPATLGWCDNRIDSLYDYLEQRNTKAFLILKDGKIVLEQYFGTFQRDSIHLWASMGKSLTATLVGIAQQENLLSINDSVSNILGAGWTSATTAQEQAITVRHLLTMSSGLNDVPNLPCDNLSDTASCLQYLAPAGSRWAYHTGAYYKLHNLVETVSGQTFNGFTNTRLENQIGMSGIWFNGTYYSKPRDVARFGILTLNKGIWATDTILHDTAYYNQMINTSQNNNRAYGYLWWLNGKASFMAPGLQTVFPVTLMTNAPADMFCALGKYDQKLYIVPSQNLIIVRMGNSANADANAFSPFDNELWQEINKLDDCIVAVEKLENAQAQVFPNPAAHSVFIKNEKNIDNLYLYDVLGNLIVQKNLSANQYLLDVHNLPAGFYTLKLQIGKTIETHKIIIEK